MKHRNLIIFGVLAIIAMIASPVFAQRTAQERQDEIAAREQARLIEKTSRQLGRDKEKDLRFEEHYYTRIVPKIDAMSIDIYATFLPVVSRITEIETRMNNIVYNTLPALDIPTAPPAGTTLPDGVVDFDVIDKFRVAQSCLDGFYYPTADRSNLLNEAPGNCLLYNIPASGVATNTTGLQVIPSPSLLTNTWNDFTSELSVIPGGFNFGFSSGGGGGWSPPIALLPILPPPLLPSGAQITLDRNGDPILTPFYGPQSLQIVTGYASQCLNDVPARYFPHYYLAQNPTKTLAEALALPLSVTLDTPCDLLKLGQQGLMNLFTGLFNRIFGTSISINTMPFPEYQALPGTIDVLPSPPFPDYPALDYCDPLNCAFVDNGAFNFALEIQTGVFKRHVTNMRDSLERIRQAYRALNHDILEAIEYRNKTR